MVVAIEDKFAYCKKYFIENNPPKNFFLAMKDVGLTWLEIMQYAVFNETKFNENQQIILDLVKYRDLLNISYYEDALKIIFPANGFTVVNTGAGSGQRECIFEVHTKIRNGEAILGHSLRCRISFSASGSRTLTSDVDTTIIPQIDFLFDADMAEANLLGEQNSDYATRIQLSIIHHFNELNQQDFGMASSLHRDTNAYVSGFLTTFSGENALLPDEIRSAYPKLKIFKSWCANLEISTRTEVIRCLQEQRLIKHQLEIAASLFPLRVTLSEGEW